MNPLDKFNPKNLPRCRLTFIATLIYQVHGQNPVPLEIRQTRRLQSEDQEYVRHLILPEGQSWQPIDVGWLNRGVSCICIRNNEGSNFTRIPSPEHRAEVDTHIVEISFDGINPHLQVIPGETHPPIFVIDVTKMELRVRNGSAKISIIAMPE